MAPPVDAERGFLSPGPDPCPSHRPSHGRLQCQPSPGFMSSCPDGLSPGQRAACQGSQSAFRRSWSRLLSRDLWLEGTAPLTLKDSGFGRSHPTPHPHPHPHFQASGQVQSFIVSSQKHLNRLPASRTENITLLFRPVKPVHSPWLREPRQASQRSLSETLGGVQYSYYSHVYRWGNRGIDILRRLQLWVRKESTSIPLHPSLLWILKALLRHHALWAPPGSAAAGLLRAGREAGRSYLGVGKGKKERRA